MKNWPLLVFATVAFSSSPSRDLESSVVPEPGRKSYRNPVLPGDFQNTDVVRAKDDYFYISATKALSPGMLVLHSRDLLNWRPIGHVVPDLTVFSPRYRHDRMDGEMRGIWAGAIAHHRGKFFVYFTTPDEGIYMSSAANPAGPWEPVTCLLPEPGWDDPCPFWDDDGQAYLVTTRFARNPKTGRPYETYLWKMDPDGQRLIPGSAVMIHHSPGAEASKLFKIGDTYYHFYSEVTREGRVPMMHRSKSLAGPYETRQLMHVDRAADREPNQGTFLQTADGKWVFVTHHGSNEWEGRPASVLPVTWVDGWPIPGRVGADGIGNMVWEAGNPVPGAPLGPGLLTSDDFGSATLGPQWEWFFQPRGDKWSLTERPGWLRLHAFPPLRPGDLRKVGNILTQRPLRVSGNVVTIRQDVSRMADGQTAGLRLLGKTSVSIAVVQTGDARSFVVSGDGKNTPGPIVPEDASVVWLRATWEADGKVAFAFSLDGRAFTALGGSFPITSFGGHLGAKLGIYTVNEKQEAGLVDIDACDYVFSRASE